MNYRNAFLSVLMIGGTSATAQETSLAAQWLNGELAPPQIGIEYDGPPIEIRYSTFLGPQTPVSEIAKAAFDQLERETGGKLVVKPYWSNTLADAQEGGYDAVASGVATMGRCYSYLSPGGFTLENGLELPFVIPDSTTGARAFMEVYPEFLRERFEAHDVYFARGTTTPPQQILSRNDPVRKLEDLQGRTMLGVGEVPSAIVSALGGAPVPVAPGELYIAFQTGVLDLMVLHDAGAITFNIDELAKYRTVANLSAHALEVCLNKNFFDDLPPDLQQVLYRWLQLWNHAESELYFDTFATQGRAEMDKLGVETITLSEEEQERWQAAVKPAVESWVDDMNAEGEPAERFIEALTQSIDKYSQMTPDEIFQDLLTSPASGLISSYDYPQ